MITNSITRNGSNLLAGLTPTFINWTQNPGTVADMVTELERKNLTTNGIGAAGNNELLYDLGTSQRRIVSASCNISGWHVHISDNGVDTHDFLNSITTQLSGFWTATGKFRFLTFYVSGVVTATRICLRCYNL